MINYLELHLLRLELLLLSLQFLLPLHLLLLLDLGTELHLRRVLLQHAPLRRVLVACDKVEGCFGSLMNSPINQTLLLLGRVLDFSFHGLGGLLAHTSMPLALWILEVSMELM